MGGVSAFTSQFFDHKFGRLRAVVAVCWLAAIFAAFWRLDAYKAESGARGNTPSLLTSADAPTLKMFIHPHCPCTRASLANLEVVLSQAPGVTADVVVVRPPGVAPNWEHSALVRAAAAIPRVRVTTDERGEQAAKFGAQTSGFVVYYDRQGRLTFSGGITVARGHDGDNPGRRDLLTRLRGESSGETSHPTFGCPLLNASACDETVCAHSSDKDHP